MSLDALLEVAVANKCHEEGDMAKTVKAKEIVHDLRSGMTEEDLKEKYGLSDTGFKNLLMKLLRSGVLESPDARERAPVRAGGTRGSFACPACGASADAPFNECPTCGAPGSKATPLAVEMPAPGPDRPIQKGVARKSSGAAGQRRGLKSIRAGHIFVVVGVLFIVAGLVNFGEALFGSPPPQLRDPLPESMRKILPPDKNPELAKLEAALEMHRQTHKPRLAAQGIVCLILGGGLVLYGRKKLASDS